MIWNYISDITIWIFNLSLSIVNNNGYYTHDFETKIEYPDPDSNLHFVIPMIQQASLAPEFPFANEASTPPNPKSSTPRC